MAIGAKSDAELEVALDYYYRELEKIGFGIYFNTTLKIEKINDSITAIIEEMENRGMEVAE